MNDSPLERATRQIEMERAQIGHEIHDALLPLLFAASAGVASVANDPSSKSSQDQLRQIACWLDDALQTGRRLLTDVYPPEMIGSLWSRLAKDTLERLFDPAITESAITWQLTPAVDTVSKPIAFAAYRIVVEAVRNAIKNGNATRVSVAGDFSKGALQIAVQDNGCGFDPAHIPADRFGVRSMIGRAELVGGTLKVESTSGYGTTVILSIPQS